MAFSPAVAPASSRWAFGDFVLDVGAQQLWQANHPVHMAPRSFALLVYLAGSGGRLVGKDELLDAVWGHAHVSDSALKVAINAVRAALADDPKAPQFVQTVARRGYRFVGARAAPAATLSSPAAAPAEPSHSSTQAPEAKRKAASTAGNLPPVQPGLIGRDAEAQALTKALATHRLVTVHGPGGVGKTRLTLAVAGAAAPEDGVWLLRLDSLSDAAPLLATVARTLGLGAGAQASPQALAEAMSGLKLRLVIDNAEHLLPAVADLVACLLGRAHDVQVLVTTQIPLHLDGEHVFALPPLALPAAGTADALRSPAVQLLLARAQHHQADITLKDEAAIGDAAEICHALDGLPLALELAAARVPLLGWSGVRARLAERMSLLTRGAHGAPERHRTLRAALAWTCELLNANELRLLHALSVFDGSFTVEAALVVAAALDSPAPSHQGSAATVLDIEHLDSLRDRSLLVRAGGAQTPRWRLYDSVRAFAAEGLAASGSQGRAQRQLVLYMTQVFAQAQRQFAHTPQLPWVAAQQAEVPNLRAAMRLALADRSLHGAAVDLFIASANFRSRGGWAREAARDHAALVALPCEPATPQARAGWDLAVAQLAIYGQMLPPQLGLDAARRAAQAYEVLNEPMNQYQALAQEGGALVRLQAAAAERAKVVERMLALEGPDWTALERRQRRWQETMLAGEQGDLAAFEEKCQAYMASGRANGDDHSVWIAAQGLAQALFAQQHIEAAVALIAPVVAQMRQQGVLREQAHVLAQWASMRIALHAAAAAEQGLLEAARLMQSEGRLWWMADALPWLPLQQGRHADAARAQAWADGLVKKRGDMRGKVFGTLRKRLEQLLAQGPEAARCLGLLAAPSDLEEGGVLHLVFGDRWRAASAFPPATPPQS